MNVSVVVLAGLGLCFASACGGDRGSDSVVEGDAAVGHACGPGSWRAGPRLNEPRELAATLLLDDGRVLVAGGHFLDPPGQRDLDSAEIFDPADETWTLTGSFRHSRGSTLGSALLSSGDVIISEHENIDFMAGTSEPIPAELYDTELGTWSQLPLMTDITNGPLIALPDGDAIVIGGSNWLAEQPYQNAQRYDAESRTWSATGSLLVPRLGHAALLLGARVLVFGGSSVYAENPDTEPLQLTAELYDPEMGSFRETGGLNRGRWSGGVVLDDGRVLTAGGDRDDGTSTELYDPETERWTPSGSMLAPRHSATFTLLDDGRVLAAGGASQGTDLDTAELYDPRTETWSATRSMPGARRLHTAVKLHSGEVLVVGGYRYDQLSTTAIYAPCLN